MNDKRIKLLGLEVTGENVPPAFLHFSQGLNLVIGASDTGKTFVLNAIDFLFGAKDTLRRVPQAEGYTQIHLSLDFADNFPVTLVRSFSGGNIEAIEYSNGRANPPSRSVALSAVHSKSADVSLSAYLLRAIGLDSHKIRTNIDGKTKALSFRDVCHLTLIDEERIISCSSPVRTGQRTADTADDNVFAYFLTGQDDGRIVSLNATKDQATRLSAEKAVVVALIDEKTAALANLLADSSDMKGQLARLEAAIDESTKVVVAFQEEINGLENTRKQLFQDRVSMRSRLVFLEEQMKRLKLLGDYYQSDSERLQTIIEATLALQLLPESSCPLCRQPYSFHENNESAYPAVVDACQKEIQKIHVLQKDLKVAIDGFVCEENQLRKRLRDTEGNVEAIDMQLHKLVTPKTSDVKSELQELIKKHSLVTKGIALQDNIHDLKLRLELIEQFLSNKIKSPVFEKRVTTSSTAEFCQIIKEILTAWRYPAVNSVSFDTKRVDLVINGQDRANMGKGYRALTYAAFSVGLMKYCRLKGIPHPGFIVLDTPVNPLRGPVASHFGDKITDEVKTAFFQYLATEIYEDQIIVIENEEPMESIIGASVYHQFTKNPKQGRYGFFPHKE